MNLSQTMPIPHELLKNPTFLLKIAENNQKIYTHIQYLKHIVETMHQMYRKMSKSIIKLSEQEEKKLIRYNDPTALSIINFIKGIQKIFLNIKEQISNNTVNINKKNQKVSKTRKDIIHQKLSKISQLFIVYMQKVSKYNNNYKLYEEQCQYFADIEKDVIKFYSTKENKSKFQELKSKQSELQSELQETYSLKIQLKSGLCEIRLSLKEFFQMLSSNSEDDKKLLLSVRKRLKQTKIFNQTIIEEVNSEAQQSIMPSNQQQQSLPYNKNINLKTLPDQYSQFGDHVADKNNKSLSQQIEKRTYQRQEHQGQFGQMESIKQKRNQQVTQETQTTFFSFHKNSSINKDLKQLINNLNAEQYCIEEFCQFIQNIQKEIVQNADAIDKLRNTEQFQKFIDKKFQINEILTTDVVYNVEAIKNEIADIRQILQSIKALLDKKKVINQLKKYRAIKSQKFINQCDLFIEQEKKLHNQQKPLNDLRNKYKHEKQKFAKGHLELMRRFRQISQDIFRQINEKFKFQRNPQKQTKKTKNQFIQKKYFELLIINFFVNKQQPPKFQMNSFLKNYEKFLSEQNLKKIGLLTKQAEIASDAKSKNLVWCGCFTSTNKKSQKNQYIDQYNCALRDGKILIQGKMKIHPNFLKFISSFNAKTLFGKTSLRIPKWDIQSIQKQYMLLSLVIVVKTVRGVLSFTSFLTDPYRKLTEVYERRELLRKTSTSNKRILLTLKSSDQEHNTNSQNTPFQIEQSNRQKYENKTYAGKNQQLSSENMKRSNKKRIFMNDLEEKFQSQIPELINKEKVSFESLSTYLSENKKQLSISVQYHMRQNTGKRYFFEIEVSEVNNKIEYRFVHQKSMEDQSVKAMLEEMASKIIGKMQNSAPKTPNKEVNTLEQEDQRISKKQKKRHQLFERCPINRLFNSSLCSFIERRQNNQFQFDKDPSFVYIKQPSVVHSGEQPSFNYEPDLQIFQNLNSGRKLTFKQNRQQKRLGQQKEVSLRFSNKSVSSNKSKSVSRQDIESYLRSIDEDTIKKSLFTRKDITNNKTLRKQGLLRQRQERQYQTKGKNNKLNKSNQGLFNINKLLLLLIVILVMNVLVSIVK